MSLYRSVNSQEFFPPERISISLAAKQHENTSQIFLLALIKTKKQVFLR